MLPLIKLPVSVWTTLLTVHEREKPEPNAKNNQGTETKHHKAAP